MEEGKAALQEVLKIPLMYGTGICDSIILSSFTTATTAKSKLRQKMCKCFLFVDVQPTAKEKKYGKNSKRFVQLNYVGFKYVVCEVGLDGLISFHQLSLFGPLS